MIKIQIIENKCKENDVANTNNVEQTDTMFPIEVECFECGSIVSVEKEDLHIGWLGEQHFTCPCCGEESMVDDLDGIKLTVDNLKFPEHFYRTNKNMRSVKEKSVDNIVRDIKECIMYLRRNKDEFAICVGSGDTMVHVYRFSDDNEYSVVVSKDFYETSIEFEQCDY